MKTISKEELASKLGSPGLVVVNVLAPPAYEKIRIRGSISIPRSELEGGRWKELDRGKEIVVHCSSYECEASRMAARFLEEKGYDVKAYEGGVKEWAESGLPMEGTVSPEQFLRERYGKPASMAPASGR
jgi:rhodanese-related sulfurtransferase